MARKRDDAIRLTRLEIVNFKKIRAVLFEPKPGLNRITSGGKNRQGKTSTIEAIRVLFEGAGAVPPEPRNDEAAADSETYIKGWFSNGFTIRRNITEKGTYLKAVSPDGFEARQSHLDQWRGGTGVDVLGWYALSPKEQMEQLARLSSVPDLIPQLRKLDEERKRLHEERTPHIQTERALKATKKPEGERPTPIDTAAATAELQELQAQQRAHQDALRGVARAQREQESAHGAVEQAQFRIDKLEQELAHAREYKRQAEIAEKEAEQRVEQLVAAVNEMPLPDERIKEVLSQLSRADEVQRALLPWAAWDRAGAEMEKAVAERVRLTKAIEDVEARRVKLISDAKFPVEGLELTAEGELRLNNRPLVQASGREKREVALAVARADNPRLRIVMLDEGSDIDAEGLEHMATLCKEHDLQLMLCRLGVEGPGELEVLDGYGGDWRSLLEPLEPTEGDDGAAAAEAEAFAKEEVANRAAEEEARHEPGLFE